MVIVDLSAWIEYLKDGNPSVVEKLDKCLEQDMVGIEDFVYCEIMQGIR